MRNFRKIFKSFLLFSIFILFCIIYYKGSKIDSKMVVPTVHESEAFLQPNISKYIFITKSYLYKKNGNYKNSTTLAILFNMALDTDINKLSFICVINDKSKSIIKRINAKIMRLMDGLNIGDCHLSIYRLICNYPTMHNYNYVENIKFGLSIDNSKPLMLSVTKAAQVKRSIIICPGRMFAFDKWHLLVTALELYRAHKVDLVIIYIHSVDVSIYELISYYKMDQFVLVRPSLQMPNHVPGLEINPNSETTFLHQLVNFQDCLYEFKESAEFIAFPDWDDIIFTHDFRPIAPVMRMIAEENPKTVSFLLARFIGVLPKLDELTFHKVTQIRLWQLEMYYQIHPQVQINGKAVVRPKFIDSVGQHDSHYWDLNYTENQLNHSEIFAIHFREGCHPCTLVQHNNNKRTEIPIKERLRFSGAKLMTTNFQSFIDKYNLEELINMLPREEKVIDQMNNCIDAMYDPAWKNAKKCRTYTQCNIPIIERPCMNVQNEWEFHFEENATISILRKNSFRKEETCLI